MTLVITHEIKHYSDIFQKSWFELQKKYQKIC